MSEPRSGCAAPFRSLVSRLGSSLDADVAISLLRRAASTPSVTGTEAVFAQLMADELVSLGAAQVMLVDFAPGRPNVRGLLRSSGSEEGEPSCRLLIGHGDTAHVPISQS